MSLRGQDESTNSSNPGVFRGLLNFIRDYDPILKQLLRPFKIIFWIQF